MSALLGFVPVVASLVLGVLYLAYGEGGWVIRTGGLAVFVLATYLQFFSAHLLAGVVLQVALAFTLEMWRRLLGGP